MKDLEIVDAIDRLTHAIHDVGFGIDSRPGPLENGPMAIVKSIDNLKMSVDDVAEAIRELTQQIGESK